MKKGPKFEADVVAWLREHGYPNAERRVQGGANDKGDVAGVYAGHPQWKQYVTLELKNCQRMELAAWIREAEEEAYHANTAIYAVVHKRHRVGDIGGQYVTMPLDVFVRLLKGT